MKIAIVVQRYGEEVNGGAELSARWLAEHLLKLADVHVLTTCAIDYHTWANAYPPGESDLNGVCIHRFPVDSLRIADMKQRTAALFLRDHTLFDEFQWVKDQGPYSTDLLDFIPKAYDQFDFFIFFTYLYAPTFFGLPLVSDKAILVPTAHEEPYIELPAFRSLFHLPQTIAYLTEPERLHVNHITGNQGVPGVVTGMGINVPDELDGDRFRKKIGLDDDFILYVGRVDHSKNVPQLLEFFSYFQAEQNRKLKLVLMGKVNIPLPDHPDILSLGFVSEQDKFDALQAASVLVVPSLYESLSMISLEAWLTETPVLANGRCSVLKYQCRRSNGGLYYHTYDEFSQALIMLLDDPSMRLQMGMQGREFVTKRYDWDIVVAKFQTIFEVLSGK
jgi:glycosyltransferase involved in cell wall biosynthesis